MKFTVDIATQTDVLAQGAVISSENTRAKSPPSHNQPKKSNLTSDNFPSPPQHWKVDDVSREGTVENSGTEKERLLLQERQPVETDIPPSPGPSIDEKRSNVIPQSQPKPTPNPPLGTSVAVDMESVPVDQIQAHRDVHSSSEEALALALACTREMESVPPQAQLSDTTNLIPSLGQAAAEQRGVSPQTHQTSLVIAEINDMESATKDAAAQGSSPAHDQTLSQSLETISSAANLFTYDPSAEDWFSLNFPPQQTQITQRNLVQDVHKPVQNLPPVNTMLEGGQNAKQLDSQRTDAPINNRPSHNQGSLAPINNRPSHNQGSLRPISEVQRGYKQWEWSYYESAMEQPLLPARTPTTSRDYVIIELGDPDTWTQQPERFPEERTADLPSSSDPDFVGISDGYYFIV